MILSYRHIQGKRVYRFFYPVIVFYVILISYFQANADDIKPPFKLKENPPGTVWLRDSVFIDVNPVKNIDYRQFVMFLSTSYSKAVRDSLDSIPVFGIAMEEFRRFMRLGGSDNELYEKMKIRVDMKLSWSMKMEEYLNSPTYRDYPVVNVSYNQALMYAQWRTHMTLLYYSAGCKNEKQRSKYYKRLRYRLPTIEEWRYAIQKFKSGIYTNKAIFGKDRACTFPAIPQSPSKLKFSYIPNNVAEMTSSEKTAIGVSWKDSDTITQYGRTMEYWGPRDWLGFRCVCEISEY